MRIEISKPSKEVLTECDICYIKSIVNVYINAYCLMSEQNNRSVFVLECVPEECAKKVISHIKEIYSVDLKEDTFMAEIDLMDLLSGGLW